MLILDWTMNAVDWGAGLCLFNWVLAFLENEPTEYYALTQWQRARVFNAITHAYNKKVWYTK